jgi:peptidyl-prolyl cis-trans isomerase B (cyclophilin B)
MININRVLPIALFATLLVACSAPKAFRKLAKDETTAIKEAKKLVPKKDTSIYVLMMTDMGNAVLKLYNSTPLHRDNFISKVKSGFYDSLLFHRVIDSFMIQGGDPQSKSAAAGQMLGGGSAPGERIAAEFRTTQGIYHKRGALAAARDNNPEKASSNCQFYIVQRGPWRTGELDTFVQRRGLTLNQEQRTLYTTQGGTPHLDGGYTVFGEAITGLDAVDRIATSPRNRSNRPNQDIRMRMFILYEPGK